jgi:hypothetical protein
MVSTRARNVHEPRVCAIGDDWQMEFDCTDQANAPLELLGAQSIEWRLTDATGSQIALLTQANGDIVVLPEPDEVTRSKCVVWFKSELTATLVPGIYIDRLRITTYEGITTTQSIGSIEVKA